MPYIGTTPTKVVSRQSANVYRYTATAGQSVFTGADLDNNVLACNPADMIVHMNGLRLESTDYTATSTSVTLTTAATAGDEVTVTSFVTFEVADTYTKTAADSRYVNTTGDTMSGPLGIGVSPSKNLDVENTMRVTNPSGTAAAELDIGSGSTWRFRAQPTSGTNAYGLDIIRGSAGTDIKMSIDSAGRVTMPYQPYALATTSVNNHSPSSGSLVQLDLAKYNRGNHFNTSNYRFTCPVDGDYLVTFFHNRYNWSGDMVLQINGSAVHYLEMRQATANWTAESWTWVLPLSTGDYIDWKITSVISAGYFLDGYGVSAPYDAVMYRLLG